jgi:hypothetical protein
MEQGKDFLINIKNIDNEENFLEFFITLSQSISEQKMNFSISSSSSLSSSKGLYLKNYP